jgi:hypothetical protein
MSGSAVTPPLALLVRIRARSGPRQVSALVGENGRMRIWDVSPRRLCRQHLLGEHRELHGLWNILVVHNAKGGYSRHPETLRWVGKTRALFERHEELVAEMERRGYQHRSPLDGTMAAGTRLQDVYIDSREDQERLLAGKPCECPLPED